MRLQTLAVFRNLLHDPIIDAFEHIDESPSAWCEFCAKLYTVGGNWTEYLLSETLCCDTPYIRGLRTREIEDAAAAELSLLQDVSQLRPEDIRPKHWEMELPSWAISPADFAAEYKERVRSVASFGWGDLAKYHMFYLHEGALIPALAPDPVTLSSLKGYKAERDEVVENTLSLLSGHPASNVLLYGDAGTGKSTTVKAIANEYRERGLRLIEVGKKQIWGIPRIIGELAASPLKFILFIDDLSFSDSDDDFGALKAILEGSISGKPRNVVIYATSNRRHLVRETFSAREGSEIHANDTIQELSSLADRFGRVVFFLKPDKSQYLSIVRELAAFYGVDMPVPELEKAAERFALSHGGRSPRAARQFIDQLMQ
ncbi:MAG: ATP-binding protein [Oscillospiraceae bacterium]|jgi:predicted AAA+ superfamily ATPase